MFLPCARSVLEFGCSEGAGTSSERDSIIHNHFCAKNNYRSFKRKKKLHLGWTGVVFRGGWARHITQYSRRRVVVSLVFLKLSSRGRQQKTPSPFHRIWTANGCHNTLLKNRQVRKSEIREAPRGENVIVLRSRLRRWSHKM